MDKTCERKMDLLAETIRKQNNKIKDLQIWIELREPGLDLLAGEIREQSERIDAVEIDAMHNEIFIKQVNKRVADLEKEVLQDRQKHLEQNDIGRSGSLEDIDRSTKEGKLAYSALTMLARTCQWHNKTKEELYEAVLLNIDDCVFMYNSIDEEE